MTGEELNILSKIKVRPVEEQRDYLLEHNMLLTGKIATLEKENAELKKKCYKKAVKDYCELEKENAELEAQIEKMKRLLNEIYSEFGFSELVKIRNDLPLEVQDVIKETEND